MDNYIVITANDSGDIRIKQLTIKELKKEIDESGLNFISPESLKNEPDPMYWNGMLIIKGEIVVPKPKEKVVEWEF